MPVSPDKQILIRFRVPPSSQGSITRRHSNRDFPTKLSAKNCVGVCTEIIGEIDMPAEFIDQLSRRSKR